MLKKKQHGREEGGDESRRMCLSDRRQLGLFIESRLAEGLRTKIQFHHLWKHGTVGARAPSYPREGWARISLPQILAPK
ncbi:hypothetical protein CEXT_112951 [Caerostris extrusa]|uniref:Uncharacterized protein n=1 Tax=Caerostris extrusa TaxID=172846 RepID=A0AAV4QBV9_CAEEX|nr:hypothetical protein CEXT_112951 [Caerostris extrusa]